MWRWSLRIPTCSGPPVRMASCGSMISAARAFFALICISTNCQQATPLQSFRNRDHKVDCSRCMAAIPFHDACLYLACLLNIWRCSRARFRHLHGMLVSSRSLHGRSCQDRPSKAEACTPNMTGWVPDSPNPMQSAGSTDVPLFMEPMYPMALQ